MIRKILSTDFTDSDVFPELCSLPEQRAALNHEINRGSSQNHDIYLEFPLKSRPDPG